MTKKTRYEWDSETVSNATDDVLDHNHSDDLRSLLQHMLRFPPAPGEHYALVLVRDVYCEFDGLVDRCWAYAEDGKLPERFSGGDIDHKIPKKYRAEYDREVARINFSLSVLNAKAQEGPQRPYHRTAGQHANDCPDLLIVRQDHDNGKTSLVSWDFAVGRLADSYEDVDQMQAALARGYPQRNDFATYQHRDFFEGAN